MQKKSKVFSFLLVVLTAFLVTSLFGDWFIERVAQLPLIKKFEIINPRTPLVINTREEVRISDTQDLVAIASKAKEKVGGLLAVQENGTPVLIGGVVSVSADGWYLTSKLAVGDWKPASLRIVLDSGNTGEVSAVVVDPVTELVFLKSNLAPKAVMPLALTSDLNSGSRVALVSVLTSGQAYTLSGTLSSQEFLSPGVWDSYFPARTALLQTPTGAVPGQAVVNNKTDLVGVWSGSSMVTASIVQEAISKLLSAQNLDRPNFGFKYSPIFENGKIVSLQVMEVEGKSPASQAGLTSKDKILQINNVKVADSSTPDALLTALVSEKSYELKVNRDGQEISLSIKPVVLQTQK